MKERHLFTYQPSVAASKSVQLFTEEGQALYALQQQIDKWLDESEIGDYMVWDAESRKITKQMMAWQFPSWDFGDEHHALMFKMIFGARFEYSVYDQE